jgi:hypothetical protein
LLAVANPIPLFPPVIIATRRCVVGMESPLLAFHHRRGLEICQRFNSLCTRLS